MLNCHQALFISMLKLMMTTSHTTQNPTVFFKHFYNLLAVVGFHSTDPINLVYTQKCVFTNTLMQKLAEMILMGYAERSIQYFGYFLTFPLRWRSSSERALFTRHRQQDSTR